MVPSLNIPTTGNAANGIDSMYVYYFIPGLFVVVSWVSFLVPPEVVPGRMAMLITLFLVLINIFNTVTSASPNTEGMNAITAWMLVCIFFVFGALGMHYTIPLKCTIITT